MCSLFLYKGLIITHGVSSSGKTYTMTGTPEDEGLIPRSFDVLFNTIQDCQASKYVFKPNKSNGFDVQPIAEALIDQQKHLAIFSKIPASKRSSSIGEWSDRVADSYIVEGLTSNRKCSVFVSYLEVYNNYIYDLLEDIAEEKKWKSSSSKMLREDSSHNMYVFNAVESEVKTVKDALELFCKGQLRRKLSNTTLSNESSRSHCVFTIRVVQAPIDFYNPEILQNQDKMIISQLSFVDLASCERTPISKIDAGNLDRKGKVSATISVLLSCIEASMNSQNVPYQESKLTHLFKVFFEGKGEIRMIVCINPFLDEYEKNAKFMKFAKLTPSKSLSKTSSKKDNSDIDQKIKRKVKQKSVSTNEILVPDPSTDFFPLEVTSFEESSYTQLIESLKKRETRRKACKQEFLTLQEEFRENLISINKENIRLAQDKKFLEMDLNARVSQVHRLESKLSSAEDAMETLVKELQKSQRQLTEVQNELHGKKERVLNQEKEIKYVKAKMKEKLIYEKLQMKRKMVFSLSVKQRNYLVQTNSPLKVN